MGTPTAIHPCMGRHRNSYYDELATFDDVEPVRRRGDQGDFLEDPTNLRDSAQRTAVVIADPAPTLPPEPARTFPRGSSQISTTQGNEVGRYAIERTLGEGTFGRVFAARDTKLGRQVALKVLHRQHAYSYEIRQRFVQEAQAAASIAHPGITTVFDTGELDESGSAFIAMELLDGESLYERVAREGPLAPAKVRELARQIASTLAAAHRVGVIHRDLKPENIFLVPDPAAADGERVKVLDFGLAKPCPQTASVKTHAATVFGTPAYMSPEQCESTRDIDRRSDVYALGCVLFFLLSGRPPFRGTMRELVQQHHGTEPPLAELGDADPGLVALIASMLAKDVAYRPQSMDDVVHALALPAGTDGMATRGMVAVAPPPATGSRIRTLSIAVAAAALAVAACLGCGAM